MAKITTQKAGKEYKSSLSGKIIQKGEQYKKIALFRGPVYVFAIDEVIPRRYTTQSPILQEIYDMQDELGKDDKFEIDAEDIKSRMESLKEEIEGSFDNLPEQFQESENGQRMQERIDNLESAIDEIDELIDEIDGILNFSEWLSEKNDEPEPEIEEFDTKEEFEEAHKEWKDTTAESFEEYKDELSATIEDLANAISSYLEECE